MSERRTRVCRADTRDRPSNGIRFVKIIEKILATDCRHRYGTESTVAHSCDCCIDRPIASLSFDSTTRDSFYFRKTISKMLIDIHGIQVRLHASRQLFRIEIKIDEKSDNDTGFACCFGIALTTAAAVDATKPNRIREKCRELLFSNSIFLFVRLPNFHWLRLQRHANVSHLRLTVAIIGTHTRSIYTKHDTPGLVP